MDMRDGAAIAEAEASYLHVEVVLIWNVWRETGDWTAESKCFIVTERPVSDVLSFQIDP